MDKGATNAKEALDNLRELLGPEEWDRLLKNSQAIVKEMGAPEDWYDPIGEYNRILEGKDGDG